MTRAGQFDVTLFRGAIDAKRRSRGVTWAEVSRRTGVHQTALSRMGRGLKPSIDSVYALLAWSGLDANAFMDER